MNDKERLEEIKKHRDEAENSIDEYEFEKINFYNLHVDWLIAQAQRAQFLEMRWELLKLELEQSESLNDHFKNDEAVDTIHDIQGLMSKMESGEYFEEFTK